MAHPWDEGHWIPGVLSKRQVTTLFDRGYVTVQGSHRGKVDGSSFDLTLSDEAFAMTIGSVKPLRDEPYGWFIKSKGLARELDRPADGIYRLEAKRTYVFRLNERLRKGLAEGGIFGQATAKSSVGRVDVLARLIVDRMDTYESFNPEGLTRGEGDMYLEVTPITFPVKVKAGISLSQLRLFYGDPQHVEVRGKQLYKAILHGPGDGEGTLSVDLADVKKGGLDVAAFFASPPAKGDVAIPLWKEDPKPEPWKHWKFQSRDASNRLQIKSSNFYLLRSKEKLSVPKGIAIYCRASDETIGEMRIHYAGFVHPGFGLGRRDRGFGTPLIFEVRGHQVNVSLADQEKMANLVFYRMSEDDKKGEEKEEDRGNDEPEGGNDAGYNEQDLELSKFFAEWPENLRRRGDDGTVERV